MQLYDLEKDMNAKIPEKKLQEILYHSSYPIQDEFIRQRNFAYIKLGHYLIELTCARHFYKQNQYILKKGLSKKLNGVASWVEKYISDNYSLENYVKKSKDERERKHPDVASKIIALLYLEYGYHCVYEFLRKIIQKYDELFYKKKSFCVLDDFKVLLLKYAQSWYMTPKYSVISDNYNKNQRKVVCMVTVGELESQGSGTTKRKAMQEAAKNFIVTHNICNIKNIVQISRNPNLKDLWRIKNSRKELLSKAKDILNLEKYTISNHQLDVIFTHESYMCAQENSWGKPSNKVIAIMGSLVLNVFCIEYLLSEYRISRIQLDNIRDILLSTVILAQFISSKCNPILLTNTNEVYDKTTMKADILKATIGFLYINSINSNDMRLANFLKEYTYAIFKKSRKNEVMKNMYFLQKIIHNSEDMTIEKSDTIKLDANRNLVCRINLSVIGPNWKEHIEIDDVCKDKAYDIAAGNILEKLLIHVDNNTREKIKSILILPLLDKYRLKSYKISNNSENSDTTHNKSNTDRKTDIPKLISFDNNNNILYVCKGTESCRKKGHNISSTTGLLANYSGNAIKLNVNYCHSCKIYFISLSEYNHYRDRYGIMFGNLIIQEEKSNGKVAYDKLRKESIIHLFGYNVGQIDNLSSQQRHKILACLMDRDIIKKYRIMEYLQYFINLNKAKENRFEAICKWTEDLNWVREYKIDNQRKYIIKAMNKY